MCYVLYFVLQHKYATQKNRKHNSPSIELLEFNETIEGKKVFMLEKEFRNEDPPAKIIGLILLVVSLLGAGSLSVKIGLQGFPPLKMALFRSILGVIAVGGIGFIYGVSMRMRMVEFPRLLLLAALQALHIITMNVGTQFTTASHSTICHTLYPVFVVLFGHFLLPGDRLSTTKLFGILAAFGGIFVVLAPNLQGIGGAEYLIGDLIVTLSAGLLAFRITLTKLFVQEIYPYRLLVWLLGLSAPFFFVLSYLFESEKAIEWSYASSMGLLYQGWVITGFCFLALTSVLRKYKASKLVVFSFLMPVSGVLFSSLLLGDKLSFNLLAGTGLVAVGIYLVNLQLERVK